MSPNGCVVLGQRRDPHGGSLRIERASGQRLTRSRIEHKAHKFILAKPRITADPCDQRLSAVKIFQFPVAKTWERAKPISSRKSTGPSRRTFERLRVSGRPSSVKSPCAPT